MGEPQGHMPGCVHKDPQGTLPEETGRHEQIPRVPYTEAQYVYWPVFQ